MRVELSRTNVETAVGIIDKLTSIENFPVPAEKLNTFKGTLLANRAEAYGVAEGGGFEDGTISIEVTNDSFVFVIADDFLNEIISIYGDVVVSYIVATAKVGSVLEKFKLF